MTTADRAGFAYQLRAVRIVFGAGALKTLRTELARAGLARAFVVSTPGRSADVATLRAVLGDAAAGAFDAATLHVPASVVDAALAQIDPLKPDCCVTLGGGSAIGLGKAIALATGLPIIAIPTTYSGSEMTDVWGVTEGNVKKTGRSAQAGPRLVVYDPDLTRSLPPGVSAASGMNAAAHAVEALYSADANPVASLLSEEALRTLARALPLVVRNPGDIGARTDALRAAHFAGSALGMTSMGLHHKLCHVLGGSFGLPHALTHAIVLPHVVAYNSAAARDAMHVIARALGGADAAAGLSALNRELGVTVTLRDLGLREDDLDRAAELAVRETYPNPRPVTREGVRAILRAAFDGHRQRST